MGFGLYAGEYGAGCLGGLGLCSLAQAVTSAWGVDLCGGVGIGLCSSLIGLEGLGGGRACSFASAQHLLKNLKGLGRSDLCSTTTSCLHLVSSLHTTAEEGHQQVFVVKRAPTLPNGESLAFFVLYTDLRTSLKSARFAVAQQMVWRRIAVGEAADLA